MRPRALGSPLTEWWPGGACAIFMALSCVYDFPSVTLHNNICLLVVVLRVVLIVVVLVVVLRMVLVVALILVLVFLMFVCVMLRRFSNVVPKFF